MIPPNDRIQYHARICWVNGKIVQGSKPERRSTRKSKKVFVFRLAGKVWDVTDPVGQLERSEALERLELLERSVTLHDLNDQCFDCCLLPAACPAQGLFA